MMMYDNGIEMIIVLEIKYYYECEVDSMVIIAMRVMISIKWTFWSENFNNMSK